MTNNKASKKNIFIGSVVNQWNKTIIIKIKKIMKHRKYGKYMQKFFKYMAHDPQNICNIGDMVAIHQCRPYSLKKKWLLNKVLIKKKDYGSKNL